MTNEPGFLIVYQLVTNLKGESIQISTNLPKDATEEEIAATLKKITGPVEQRLIEQNEKILALTEATSKAFDELNKPSTNGQVN